MKTNPEDGIGNPWYQSTAAQRGDSVEAFQVRLTTTVLSSIKASSHSGGDGHLALRRNPAMHADVLAASVVFAQTASSRSRALWSCRRKLHRYRGQECLPIISVISATSEELKSLCRSPQSSILMIRMICGSASQRKELHHAAFIYVHELRYSARTPRWRCRNSRSENYRQRDFAIYMVAISRAFSLSLIPSACGR